LAVAIGLSKVGYYPGEPIVLNLIWAQGAIPVFTVVVADLGAKEGDFKTTAGPGDDQSIISAPGEPGNYEIRVYSGTEGFSPETLLAKASIDVTGLAVNAFNLKVIGENFRPGNRIDIEVSGVSEALIKNGAFVGVFPVGARNEAFNFAISISDHNEKLFVDLPYRSGQYEIRAYAGNKPITDNGLVVAIPIEVK
jgi:hypothetical protein